jgi:hypothetical protein
MPELLNATISGTRVSPILRQPPAGQRAAVVVEVSALNGPVTFVTETSRDDGATWQRDHTCTMEGPARSIVPARRGVLLRVTKSGARCTVVVTTDRGEVA